MKSLMDAAVFLQICWSLFAVVSVEGERIRGFPEHILDLMSVVNGDLDNSADIMSNDTKHDFIQARLVPVQVSALPGKPVIYMEQSVNGFIYRMLLAEIIEVGDQVLQAIPYNFTDSSQYKPGTYDLRELYKVTPENLQTNMECVGTFKRLGPAVYRVNWPDCRQAKIDGEYPHYNVTLSCNTTLFSPPETSKEKSSGEPYLIQPHGHRYPVVGAPSDYVSPCDKKQ